jgi:hypothetical protein
LPVGATAGSLATLVPTVSPDDSLLVLGEKLWTVDWGELPVVDPAAPQRVLGVVTRRALLGAFERELVRREVPRGRLRRAASALRHHAGRRAPRRWR